MEMNLLLRVLFEKKYYLRIIGGINWDKQSLVENILVENIFQNYNNNNCIQL